MASGSTEHHVETDSVVVSSVEVILRVDISGCMALPAEDRLECVKAIAESLKEIGNVAEILLCARDLETQSGDESIDTPVSCRNLIPVESEPTSP